MLRFLCRQATILLVFSIGNKAVYIDPEYYAPLSADIQEYYKVSGILLLYDDDVDIEFETQINIAGFLRRFSGRLIPSQALHYSRVKYKTDYYVSTNVQTLFAVFLTSERNLEDFSLATAETDMSYHTWLVVFISDRMNEHCYRPIGNPFHVVFNTRMIVKCFEDDRIYKWYSLYKNHTEVLELAKWKRGRSLVSQNQKYYESRFDLSGKVIRIATPTSSVTESSAKMYGYFNDLLAELQSFMNFTVKKVHEAESFGKLDTTNKSWTGLIGSLASGEVDMIVAPVTMTKYRKDYVDYSRPLLLSANRLYIKQPLGVRVPWSAYFRTFSLSSWAGIGAMFVLSSFLTAYIRATLEESRLVRMSLNYILENFIRIWGIYCQQGVPEFPSATPLRMAYVTKMLLTLIIWGMYTASITSYLTVLTPSLPFSDTHGFVVDGSYKLIVMKNSSDESVIMSGEDPVLLSMRPLLKNVDELPTNPYAGFLQVCNERVGFYSSEAVLRGMSGPIPCDLTYIETGQYECLALALAKRSPYISSINYNLRKLQDNGVLRKLHGWYFRKTDNISPPTNSSIGFWSIVPLLSVIGVGFGMAVTIFFIEHCHRARQRKRPTLHSRRNFY